MIIWKTKDFKKMEMWDGDKLIGIFSYGVVQHEIDKRRMEAFYRGVTPETLPKALKTINGTMEKMAYWAWQKRERKGEEK